LRHYLHIFLEGGENPQKIRPSWLVSGLCAGYRNFLRILRAFSGLTGGHDLHVIFLLRQRSFATVSWVGFWWRLIARAHRADDGVLFHGGRDRGDEITVVVVVISIDASVGSTGHDESC
jgi:hypothetical protein